MSDKGLLDVIEGMLEEGINDHINKIGKDNVKDGANWKPTSHTSADTQGIMGSTSGQAQDMGGDKDVGHQGHGKHPSAASADTQGVEGKTSGQAQDMGGDTDVGKTGKGEFSSDASADTQGVEGKTSGQALDAGGDKDVGKLRREDYEDDIDEDEYMEEEIDWEELRDFVLETAQECDSFDEELAESLASLLVFEDEEGDLVYDEELAEWLSAGYTDVMEMFEEAVDYATEGLYEETDELDEDANPKFDAGLFAKFATPRSVVFEAEEPAKKPRKNASIVNAPNRPAPDRMNSSKTGGEKGDSGAIAKRRAAPQEKDPEKNSTSSEMKQKAATMKLHLKKQAARKEREAKANKSFPNNKKATASKTSSDSRGQNRLPDHAVNKGASVGPHKEKEKKSGDSQSQSQPKKKKSSDMSDERRAKMNAAIDAHQAKIRAKNTPASKAGHDSRRGSSSGGGEHDPETHDSNGIPYHKVYNPKPKSAEKKSEPKSDAPKTNKGKKYKTNARGDMGMDDSAHQNRLKKASELRAKMTKNVKKKGIDVDRVGAKDPKRSKPDHQNSHPTKGGVGKPHGSGRRLTPGEMKRTGDSSKTISRGGDTKPKVDKSKPVWKKPTVKKASHAQALNHKKRAELAPESYFYSAELDTIISESILDYFLEDHETINWKLGEVEFNLSEDYDVDLDIDLDYVAENFETILENGLIKIEEKDSNHFDKDNRGNDSAKILGKKKGQPLDAGGDKDVGKVRREDFEHEEDYEAALEEARKDKGDMDGDGKDEPDDKEYMDNKDAAIKKAMKEESDCDDEDDKSEDDDKDDVKEDAEAVMEDDVPGSDEATYKPKANTSGDLQGILGKKAGQALDAGGDKDVGKSRNKGKASSNTQGVLGKKSGQALDAGADKDVGKLKEDADSLISEEYKQRAEVIFEAAVGEKVGMLREEMEVEFEKQLTEEKERLNDLAGKYMEEAVGEWLQENALEVRYSLRTEIAENFIRGLKGLFQESYIEIPEDEASVVDELTEAVEEQRDQISEMEAELAEARAFILESKKAEVINSLCEDLTQTQAIRLEKLAEGLEAESIDEFAEKAKQLKEGYFDESAEMPMLGALSEQVLEPSESFLEESIDSSVSMYAAYLGKTVQK